MDRPASGHGRLAGLKILGRRSPCRATHLPSESAPLEAASLAEQPSARPASSISPPRLQKLHGPGVAHRAEVPSGSAHLEAASMAEQQSAKTASMARFPSTSASTDL
eukprot:360935-Chlamydomonas_euryale.AAC.2